MNHAKRFFFQYETNELAEIYFGEKKKLRKKKIYAKYETCNGNSMYDSKLKSDNKSPHLAQGNPSERARIHMTYLWLYTDRANTRELAAMPIHSLRT